MNTYPIIPDTKEIAIEELSDGRRRFPLFGTGNEKRDLVLLVRGDVRIERPVCVSFFGCINCGYMATGSAGFHRMNSVSGNGKTIVCTNCESVDTVYYFDGVWKGSWGEIIEGVKEDKITVSKM